MGEHSFFRKQSRVYVGAGVLVVEKRKSDEKRGSSGQDHEGTKTHHVAGTAGGKSDRECCVRSLAAHRSPPSLLIARHFPPLLTTS